MIKRQSANRPPNRLALAVVAAAVMQIPTALATPEARSTLSPGLKETEIAATAGLLQQARVLAAVSWFKPAVGLDEHGGLVGETSIQPSELSPAEMVERVLSYYPQSDAGNRVRVLQVLGNELPKASGVARAACHAE